ncbi:hypothetical protein HYT53_05655 [Candidatus Woesearchaeota archaeon]|nr:hypothetical protein [Candidatus Woesearchaeota archaeon]
MILTSVINSLDIIAYAIDVEKIKLIQTINCIRLTDKIIFTPTIKFILALTIIAQIKI